MTVKVKVKVAPQPLPDKIRQTVSDESLSMFPSMARANKKKKKGYLGRLAYIAIEDIKSIFGADKKTREKTDALKKFKELVKR